jgi:hypothetical protein
MSTDHAKQPRRVLRTAAVAAAATVALVATWAAPATSATAGHHAAGARAQSTSPPPKPLTTIEEQAEDIGDRVPGKRWARIAADVTAIKAAWARFQTKALADGIPAATIADFNAALDRLAAAAKAKNGPDTSQGANDISGVVVELFASYKLDAPVQVGRLDIIGRQIELDLDADNPDGVTQQIDQARTEWEAIRAEVAARSVAVPTQVDATLDALGEAQRAGNTRLLHAETRVLLELVDSIEELYG